MFTQGVGGWGGVLFFVVARFRTKSGVHYFGGGSSNMGRVHYSAGGIRTHLKKPSIVVKALRVVGSILPLPSCCWPGPYSAQHSQGLILGGIRGKQSRGEGEIPPRKYFASKKGTTSSQPGRGVTSKGGGEVRENGKARKQGTKGLGRGQPTGWGGGALVPRLSPGKLSHREKEDEILFFGNHA